MEDVNLAVLMRKHSKEVERLQEDKQVLKDLVRSLETSLKLKDTALRDALSRYMLSSENNSKLASELAVAEQNMKKVEIQRDEAYAELDQIKELIKELSLISSKLR